MRFNKDTLDNAIKNLKNQPTSELVFDWSILYAMASRLQDPNKENKFLENKFGGIEGFKKYAQALYDELVRRGVNVKVKPPMDQYVTAKKVEATMPQIPMVDSEVDSEVETTPIDANSDELDAIVDQLPNKIIIKPGFIKLVGSRVNSLSIPTEDSDIDIFIDAPVDNPTWLHKHLHIIMSRLFGPHVQLIYQSNVNGPTEDHLNLYDLVLVKNPQKVTTYQFSKVLKVSNVTVAKPYKAYYGLENFKPSDIPFEKYIIEPKYNGMRLVIFDGGHTVYSEDGNKLPIDLSFVFKSNVPKDYVFTGEIWSESLPRQTVIGMVKRGELSPELNITIYGIVRPQKPYATELELIKKFVKPAYRVKTFTNLEDAIKYVERRPSFDGIIIKDLTKPSTDPKQMIKVKKAADFDVQVLKKFVNKNGTYKYLVGYLDDDGSIQPLGKTFSTSKEFNPGDIIEIEAEEIEYYKDDDILSGYAMRVKGASNNSKPYTKKQILKVAKNAGILNIITNSE